MYCDRNKIKLKIIISPLKLVRKEHFKLQSKSIIRDNNPF